MSQSAIDRRGALRADVIAGLTLAAYLLPSGIATASLAGLPPEAGLYACVFGGLVFWLSCSSRHTAVTVTSPISLLVGTAVGTMSGGDIEKHVALSMSAALLVGLMAIAAWAARAGVIVNFVSETVLVGFKCGVAFALASSQLPKLFGFAGVQGSFWAQVAHVVQHLGQTHTPSLALGSAALAILVAGNKLWPGKPIALFVVIAGVAATSMFDLEPHGVKVLGTVPQGLPPFGLPSITLAELDGIVPIAVACFLLGAVESAAIGRMFALKHGYRFDPNRELLAIGTANLASGLGHGYPISGGMSQSLVNESAGAESPVSGFIAALLILLVTLWFSGLLRDLPQPVLAAIVLAAVTGLVKIRTLKRLWRFDRAEFAVAAVAFLGVLGQGTLRGVFLGVLLSIVMLLRRASNPNVAELGRVGNTDAFTTLSDGPDRQRIPNVFVGRVDGALLYFNAERVRDRFAELLKERGEAHTVVLSLAAVPIVDLAGAEMIMDAVHSLNGRGVTVRLTGANAGLRRSMVQAGMDEAMIGTYKTIGQALS